MQSSLRFLSLDTALQMFSSPTVPKRLFPKLRTNWVRDFWCFKVSEIKIPSVEKRRFLAKESFKAVGHLREEIICKKCKSSLLLSYWVRIRKFPKSNFSFLMVFIPAICLKSPKLLKILSVDVCRQPFFKLIEKEKSYLVLQTPFRSQTNAVWLTQLPQNPKWTSLNYGFIPKNLATLDRIPSFTVTLVRMISNRSNWPKQSITQKNLEISLLEPLNY